MFDKLHIKDAMINVCNFDNMSIFSKNFPIASEIFAQKHNLTKIRFIKDKDCLTLPQLRVLYDFIGLPYLSKNLGLTEGLKEYFDLIENEVFIIHHIRQFFFNPLPKQKDFYHLEVAENPVLRLGIRERNCSSDNLLLENNNQYKERVVERLRPLQDFKDYMSEALSTGTAFLKLPSGTTLTCMSTPFMLKEYDSDFSFSAQDFKNLFKGMSSCLTVSGGHTELDGLSMLPLFFEVIRGTYRVLSQRCQGIFEPIAHKDILRYIGRENADIPQEIQYKDLSSEERQQAEKLAKDYKDMIGNFLQAFYNKTNIEDLDNIEPEEDFKYKHQLFIAGELKDERITKTWVKYII